MSWLPGSALLACKQLLMDLAWKTTRSGIQEPVVWFQWPLGEEGEGKRRERTECASFTVLMYGCQPSPFI